MTRNLLGGELNQRSQFTPNSGESELPKIYWRNLLGNPYLQPLSPEMLTREGFSVVRECKIPGCRSTSDVRQQCVVVYDREYVLAKLASTLEPIASAGYNDLIALVSQAWQYRKKHGSRLLKP